ncbi:hypothetical protein [Kineosporia succinea]|uniref:Type II secretory pathway component PulJ n=1 Tax=Kineosporia succinea TaxID=84632 RepID=A0ABT9NV70_9ACTN|nr:hypothetical protein [Kineosporia succinea]MDP9824313.1 type II secretory pathway component PulJ [Kineosporia succinea]
MGPQECDRNQRDAGLSLAELVVAVGVASVLMIAIGVVFNGTLQGVGALQVKTSATADARIAMEAMTRSVRVVYKPDKQSAIEQNQANAITFYALLNRTGSAVTQMPQPTKVQYLFEGNCIRQKTWPASVDAAGNVTWPSSGLVSTCLARTSVAPTFTYYPTGSGTATVTDPNLVRSIGISVEVRDPARPKVKSVQLVGRVTLTNLVADDNNPDSNG